MSILIKLDADEGVKNVDTKAHKSMIGALVYLTISGPNIIFNVCIYARFQVNPKELHLNVIKRIFRYLKRT